ncbi:hypothetical protein BDB00DRAFT_877174 [Zychaea mexicana]|uniref:uncharacterized protein n=1 Tax=Zychaea mexicana TaxID=64656 RepID=UPI0022FDF7B6|nr:uncharacterized protein BDB00DRAFT_877174 [Zychaea mexicana]KAI9488704.1 hypothetical protein BDB00DRAFT_877174 [Zychaea mexicana]
MSFYSHNNSQPSNEGRPPREGGGGGGRPQEQEEGHYLQQEQRLEDQGQNSCMQCGMSFGSENAVRRHSHYQCPNGFEHIGGVEHPVNPVRRRRPSNNNDARRASEPRALSLEHLQLQNPGDYECRICHLVFDSSQLFQEHIATPRSQTSCLVCGSHFFNRSCSYMMVHQGSQSCMARFDSAILENAWQVMGETKSSGLDGSENKVNRRR